MKVCFLDRDGIVNIDYGYVYKPQDLILQKGIVDLMTYLKTLEYQFIIVTNQSGIGRGFYDEAKFRVAMKCLYAKLSLFNLEILATFHCPHTELDQCNCRKPRPGMFEEAINRCGLNVAHCISVGDNYRDIEAARQVGVVENYLVNSKITGPVSNLKSKERWFCDLNMLLTYLMFKNKER